MLRLFRPKPPQSSLPTTIAGTAAPVIGGSLALSVIVPSRNERENVGRLLERLAGALEGRSYQVIFVDDSDDGTDDLLAALAAESYPDLQLLHRPPDSRFDGLSGAIFEGIAVARGEYLAVLDADLQHPPELLYDMLEDAEASGADVVIASRYVAGGTSEGLDGWSRRFISKASALVCRLLFHERLWRVSDPCSGFFIVRRRILDGVRLRPIGFKILLEILMRARWNAVHETPYRFGERGGGSSKATPRQGQLFAKHLLRLTAEVPGVGRLPKFAAVGSTGFVVNMALLWLFAVPFGLPRYLAWAASTEIAIVSNFLFNRWFTWSDRAAAGFLKVVAQGARYHLAVAAGLAANGSVFWLTSQLGLPLLVCGVAGVLGGAVANFLFCNNIVFPDGEAEAAEQRKAGAPGVIAPR
jgi:dolichol-phosphate mannosyltransferase